MITKLKKFYIWLKSLFKKKMDIYTNEIQLVKKVGEAIYELEMYITTPQHTPNYNQHHKSMIFLGVDQSTKVFEFQFLSKRFAIIRDIRATTGYAYLRTYLLQPNLEKSSNWEMILIPECTVKINTLGDKEIQTLKLQYLGKEYFEVLLGKIE